MSQLHVAAEATSQATPETVWALVSDATRYPEFGPWSAGGYRRPGDESEHGPGAVRWLRSSQRAYLRHAMLVEQILAAEEGRRLAYSVLSGIPVRNYRAEVTLTPVAGGTHIRWAASWDNTMPGRIVERSLRTVFPAAVTGLAATAERQSGQRA